MEVSGQLHALAALPLAKSPKYPLDRRLAQPHSWSGCGGKEKTSLLNPCWEFNHRCPAHDLLSILTELPQLTS